MEKRRNKKYNNWNNQKKSDSQNREPQKKSFQYNPSAHYDAAAEKAKFDAIAKIKAKENLCPICGQQIFEMASAMVDKASGKPAHFDCVLNKVKETEKVSENERIAYIGQGRFGVVYYENPRDQRHFQIKKIIEWENRDTKPEWREEMGAVYSQVI